MAKKRSRKEIFINRIIFALVVFLVLFIVFKGFSFIKSIFIKEEKTLNEPIKSELDSEKKDPSEEDLEYLNFLKKEAKNPESNLVLVNKSESLSEDHEPEDLIIPNIRFLHDEQSETKYMRKEAAEALEELYLAAEEEGIYLFAVSGYRSYGNQKYIYNTKLEKSGPEEAEKFVAKPGTSEHQSGLAMDLTSQSIGFKLDQAFEDTEEGKWLEENSYKYGFIIRYKKDKEDITKYSYEPWHIRYVGKEHAKEIYEKNLCLEEYLGFE